MSDKSGSKESTTTTNRGQKSSRSRLGSLPPPQNPNPTHRQQPGRLEQFSTLQQPGRRQQPSHRQTEPQVTQPPTAIESKVRTEVERATLPTFKLKPGWTIPQEDIPESTYWPVNLALAITFIAFGVVTNLLFSALGFLLFVVALVGWVGDIRKEQRQHSDKHQAKG